MKRIIGLTFVTLVLFLIITACASEPEVVVVTVPVVTEIEITATAVPTETAAPPTTPPEPTDMPEPTAAPTKTLSPIQATQQAIVALMPTRVPMETSPVIAEDDYVALTNQACEIVRDNYVRDNYNGVDWDAKCAEYAVLAETVDDQEAFWDLMEAFIRELDDNHSRFVRPDRFAAEFDLPTEGSGRPWPGMQIWPAREDEQLLIWYVCEFGPAASAGLQRGDVILAINGEPMEPTEEGFDRNIVNQSLYANEDGAVLTVQRGPDREPEEIALTFGGAGGCDGWRVELLSATPRIGYVRVPDFGGDSATNIMTAIELLEEDGALDGLVLDIRHNPGGNADESMAIFTEGIFGKVGSLRSDSTQTIYRIRGPVRWNETTPLAVLTDGNSHSAADYFAAAMKVGGRATLVGMPSAGNTEGINGFNLADGTIIRLAWTTLELPDGNTIEGVGIIPDIQVPLGGWGLREVPDVQLQAAYEALTE
ncbi:MAG: PDZ domain-containing protein [Chloroflexi bacterium]|nr:PDZ domain-containing protein [Chloroflexota bacterium]